MQLTEDDITAILFTSLDHDHLTDLLCLPGELLKWVTTNFAGESTAESDFLAAKHELWEATVSLAQRVVEAAKELSGDKSQLFDHQWWEHTRYGKVGTEIASKLGQG